MKYKILTNSSFCGLFDREHSFLWMSSRYELEDKAYFKELLTSLYYTLLSIKQLGRNEIQNRK